jgi:iron uptake system component EfeO
MNSVPARRLPRPRVPALLGAIAVALGLLAGCGGAATRPSVISFNTGQCGVSWRHSLPGPQTLQIYNGSGAGAEVDLIDPANGAIYDEVDDLGPGSTAPLQVDLGSGSYALRCLIEDQDAVTGPVVRIGGHVKGQRAVQPVTEFDLVAPAKQYQVYVTARLVQLVAQARTLAADIQAGNLAAARAAWLSAHLTYEGLGAAYGTFGNFDTEIDGTATGLVGGAQSSQFTGFYRLEYGLWHGQSAQQLSGPAQVLLQDVLGLQAGFPTMEVALLDIGLRTHEIMENALQFQLSDEDDYGSGTTLATTLANIGGTEELLTILHPLLVPRYSALPQVYTWLTKLQALLGAQQQPGGTWTPVSQLSTTAREHIDAAADQLLAELAPIAVITQPRRTT